MQDCISLICHGINTHHLVGCRGSRPGAVDVGCLRKKVSWEISRVEFVGGIRLAWLHPRVRIGVGDENTTLDGRLAAPERMSLAQKHDIHIELAFRERSSLPSGLFIDRFGQGKIRLPSAFKCTKEDRYLNLEDVYGALQNP